MALTLQPWNPIKCLQSLYTISTLQLPDGLAQSPLEAVPLDLLWEGPEALLAGGQLLALWEEGV